MDRQEEQIVDRIYIRREIIRIITYRLSARARRYYKLGHIKRQAHVFESFLYKRAACLEDYSNLDTLERRVLGIARAMALDRHRLFFTYFDLRP